jgi:glycosyltransferase involved in cell wall biosynthesis
VLNLAGYGVQTRLTVPRLQGLGHDIAISCLWGLEGGMIPWTGPRGVIPCFPKGFALYSQDRLPQHAQHFQADAIVTLVDAWVMEPEKMAGKPWAAYYPVDMEPLPGPVADRIRQAALRIAMSRYGEKATNDAGMDCVYVPHCFDSEAYYPHDPAPGREYLKAEGGRFIVGVVAANKGIPPRKSFPQIFEAFAAFHKKHREALLYVHSHMGIEYQGIDLGSLASYYEIPNEAIRGADQYMLGNGMPDEAMAQLYSAFDVLLCPSMGEGFGVPIVEAQACGTPVITGDWTAMPELTVSGMSLAREDAYPYHIPSFSTQYLPKPAAIESALEEALDWRYDPAEVAAGVAEYDADTVTETWWKPALAALEAITQPAVVAPNRAERRRLKVKGKVAA